MPRARSSREDVAQRLRIAREQAGLSQGQVARLLDMHRPTISEIEAGRRSVAAEELSQFAKLYAVDPNWLLAIDDGVEGVESAVARLAAREFEKMRPEDLDRLLRLLSSLRKGVRR